MEMREFQNHALNRPPVGKFEFDLTHKSGIASALGDQLYLIAIQCRELGWSLDDIAEMNMRQRETEELLEAV